MTELSEPKWARVKWYMSFSVADVGLSVIETGESGMKGSRGVLVPSTSSPGTLSVLWLTTFTGEDTGRMQTSLTYGTTPDVDTRSGFLWLVDYCEDLGLKEIVEDRPATSPRESWSITEIRASYWWTSRRQTITRALVRAISQT